MLTADLRYSTRDVFPYASPPRLPFPAITRGAILPGRPALRHKNEHHTTVAVTRRDHGDNRPR
ncbi:hypothetical protein [Streptoalloteichus tenebrarius]|uniref:hypothetical protein n=1 Tax=Streptoalloteichus tenebrarius (strain ATCC 17920 / DSM 40477 / JCM 4838 / CBS 697.72 / NBRC 16177 / NCIMB 11028 / NRRL B-12390 / A12253. 1 / ISP 5477) TaxID=1933 RepID=UPI0020A55669|nr:hypothetical protein [Streptoalloteichus tenebrarius]